MTAKNPIIKYLNSSDKQLKEKLITEYFPSDLDQQKSLYKYCLGFFTMHKV